MVGLRYPGEPAPPGTCPLSTRVPDGLVKRSAAGKCCSATSCVRRLSSRRSRHASAQCLSTTGNDGTLLCVGSTSHTPSLPRRPVLVWDSRSTLCLGTSWAVPVSLQLCSWEGCAGVQGVSQCSSTV